MKYKIVCTSLRRLSCVDQTSQHDISADNSNTVDRKKKNVTFAFRVHMSCSYTDIGTHTKLYISIVETLCILGTAIFLTVETIARKCDEKYKKKGRRRKVADRVPPWENVHGIASRSSQPVRLDSVYPLPDHSRRPAPIRPLCLFSRSRYLGNWRISRSTLVTFSRHYFPAKITNGKFPRIMGLPNRFYLQQETRVHEWNGSLSARRK